jgi:hypothetical protein
MTTSPRIAAVSTTTALLAEVPGWRHHCYELHLGCTHLGWHAWTGDRDELHAVARRLGHILERGPLADT